jgi:hypothetical protein
MKHLLKAIEEFKPIVVKSTLNEKGNLEIIQEFINPRDFVICKDNEITFKIQDGVISENGVNGIQAVDLIRFTLELIKSLNNEFSCRENSITITKLEEAINSQENRTLNRIIRNVESKNII